MNLTSPELLESASEVKLDSALCHGLPARSGSKAGERLNVNTHIHLPPNFSAFETAAQAVELAKTQNVRVLGASNYYDYTVYDEFAAQCKVHGIVPLFGTEIICLIDEMRTAGIKINDPGNPGKMYICGKGLGCFSPMSDTAAGLLQTIRNNDSRRMALMIGRLAEQFALAGIDAEIGEAAVKAMVVARHGCAANTVFLQERHVAQAFQEHLFAVVPIARRAETLAKLFGCAAGCAADDTVGIQNEIRAHLMKAGKAAFVPETFVGFEHAYNLILALGGIPCYPTLIDGAGAFCGYEADVDDLIAATLARGIHCCEVIPVRNSPEELTRYVTAMRRAGLIVTAGTEHNTRDVIPMNPTCVNGEVVPDPVQEIFWEGACVVAAHQYLTKNGNPGYVKSDGRLAGEYPTNEERIAHLSSLGAELIHRAADGP